MERGCLWNSFVMVGCVDALLRMTRAALPELYADFAALAPMFETTALTDSIQEFDDTNFSQEVLAQRPQDLAVMRVGDVGWSDLGEPSRVLATLQSLGTHCRGGPSVAGPWSYTRIQVPTASASRNTI